MRTATLPFHETDMIAAACSYPGCRSAVSPHHSPHLIEAAYIERVRREATEAAAPAPKPVDKTCPTCHRTIEREAGDPHPNSPGDHDPAYHVAKAYGTTHPSLVAP